MQYGGHDIVITLTCILSCEYERAPYNGCLKGFSRYLKLKFLIQIVSAGLYRAIASWA